MFSLGPAPVKRPTIYYYCYCHNHPTGGQKDTYRHVDLLNEIGFDAFALHEATDFRLSWFANETRVVDSSYFRNHFRPDADFLVLPEDLGKKIRSFPGRKVIFDKGVLHGFQSLGRDPKERAPYLDSSIQAVFVMSKQNEHLLRYAYPQLPLIRVRSHIDATLFQFQPLAAKKRQIVIVPKAPGLVCGILRLIRARFEQGLNNISPEQIVFLEKLSEREVAALLKESLVLVFPSIEEGMPRTALEALASGCLVAAFRAGPMAECVPSSTLFEYGDLCGMVGFLETLFTASHETLSHWNEVTHAGKRIAEDYSPDIQKHDLAKAWESILASSSLSRVDA